MSKILAVLSGCSMAACFLGSVLALGAYGVLSAIPPDAAQPQQPAPVAPKAPPVTPKPTPKPQPKPQPRNPRSPH